MGFEYQRHEERGIETGVFMSMRAEFEKRFTVPKDACWDEQCQSYWWDTSPGVFHPFNESWLIWKEACEWQVSALHGEEIHVNVEGDDVYMLPLQPSGMESPRFVVHVPAVSHLEWSHTLLDGEPVTLSEAEEAVAKLGEGWRLPTRQELESLLDLSRHDPAIDTSKYPDTKSCAYWTSTPVAGYEDAARWAVYFCDGSVSGYGRRGSAFVLAVRDVEEGA
jgi:hypothetical protein